MEWLEFLETILSYLMPIVLTAVCSFLIALIKKKIAQVSQNTENSQISLYLALVESTVVDCIKATNQVYVDELKEKNLFDKTAQQLALQKTTDAVLAILSDEVKNNLSLYTDDLALFIQEKIEANIKLAKK